ncbi:MAG TPA: LLM class flavin-dependent oxidoreductase [Dehalococcoidia bacterium]|nr:LLM class flavin-dependent oxidoreductase [Dehalococcoidia bacterium]
MNNGLEVGISLSISWPLGLPESETLLSLAEHCDAHGFDALWSGDHVQMYSPLLDSLTLLAAYAARTKRLKIGVGVYLLGLRHPLAAAKQLATIDYLSNGRFICGIGVGGEITIEWDALGIPVKERASRVDEGIAILKRLWGDEPSVTHEGRHYRFRDIVIDPKPPQGRDLPIWIGGRSDAALRRAARVGDGWLAYVVTPDRYRESLEKIQAWAPEYGRDPSRITPGTLIFISTHPDRAVARRRAVEGLTVRYNQNFENLVDKYCAFGTVDECTEAIAQYVAAGVRHVVLSPLVPAADLPDQVALWTEELLPALRKLPVP